MWEYAGNTIKQIYPHLQSEIISFQSSSCRFYYIPEGIRDVGKALLFGEVVWGKDSDTKMVFQSLERIARNLKVTKIVGPIDFSTYLNYRLRLDHFEEPSFVGEPVNSIASVQSLYQMGYKIDKKYFSHEFKVSWNIKFITSVILFGLWSHFKSPNKFTFKNFSCENYKNFLPEIYDIIDSVFSENYLYQKIPYSMFELLFETKILPFVDFNTTILALDHQNKLAGFSLCLKDQNKQKRLLFKTIGVKPEYRKGSFLGRQLMLLVYKAARKKYQTCMACLMIEGNKPEKMFRKNSIFTKSYAVFSKTSQTYSLISEGC